MKTVAIAGGSGNVAQEVIDQIVARNTYKVVILSRQPVERSSGDNAEWVQVDYESRDSLAQAFSTVDTVLSFLAIPDPAAMVRLQKNMIDAAIMAGVRRFAPGEWGSTIKGRMEIYGFKEEIRQYLEEVNKDQLKLEYCLFQPGYFTNYFGYPYATTKHFSMSATYVDFENRKAIMVDDGNHNITLTTVQDLGKVVARALEFPETWPVVGGISGTEITLAQLIKLGESLRGPFAVETVRSEDLKAGNLNVEWFPLTQHPSIPPERAQEMSKFITLQFLNGVQAGGWSASNEWNTLLGDGDLTTAEEYLKKIWSGKP